MRFATRFLAVALSVGLFGLVTLSVGCSSKNTTPPDSGSGTCTACVTAADCPTLYACDQSSGCCTPSCNQNSDCAHHPAYDGGPFPQCTGQFGCNCDQGTCKPFVCSSDSDCGTTGLSCISGQCTTPATVASCTIEPAFTVLNVGYTAQFYALAQDSNSKVVPVPPGTMVMWSAADSSVTAVDATSGKFKGASATAATGTTDPYTAATASVTASIGGKTCTGKVFVYPANATGTRVTVVDELTHLPVSNATVLLGNDPTVATNVTTTNSLGQASFTTAITSAAPQTVSVFHNSFSYLTLVNMQKSDLLIPLRRNATDAWGGYQGQFTNLSTSADVHIGIAGMSIPGNLVDFTFDVLVGPGIPTTITFSGQNFPCEGIPSGIVLGLGGSAPFKGTYDALGLAGTCSSETSMQAGTCGTRAAWSMSGDVPIADLPLNQLTGGGGSINIGAILAGVLPLFGNFNAQVVRDQEFGLETMENSLTCNGSTTMTPNFGDNTSFPSLNLAPNVPFGLKTFLDVPKLPQVDGQYMEGAVIIGGSLTPGRGVVPLGLTAGLTTDTKNTTANGLVIDANDMQTGVATLRMAPNNNGTEQTQYGLVAIALQISQLGSSLSGGGGGGTSLSGVTTFKSDVTYQQTPSPGGSDVQFPSFLNLPTGATFDYRGGSFTALPTAATPASGQYMIYRVAFSDSAQHRWVVYYPANSTTVTVPGVPTGNCGPAACVDRTMSDDAARLQGTKPGSNYLLAAMQLGAGINITDTDALGHLFDFSGGGDSTLNETSLVSFNSAFGVQAYNYPKVSIVSPQAGTLTSDMATVTVQVDNFAVPTAGSVAVTATPSGTGTAVSGSVTSLNAMNQGSTATPLALTSGTTYTLTATLVDTSSNPIAPPVSASITVKAP
jgi:hypothetical protein